MNAHLAYGLQIRSEIPLPELLPAAAGEAEVVIRLGRAESPTGEPLIEGRCFHGNPGGGDLFYEGVGAFQVRNGCEIFITPAPGVEERTLRLFLLGPALAVLLHQRGRLILHASAVAVGGRVVAFLGGSGWGKSTMAATLHAQGHAVVADDVVAVDVQDRGHPLVYPGIPQLKLWPDVIRTLGESPERLASLRPKLDKRAYPVHHDGLVRPIKLRSLYVLAEGAEPKVEPLGAGEAVVELIRHTYGVRLLSGVNPRSHLRQCTALAARVPVCRLRRPRDLSALPALAQCVEEDMAHASVDRRYRRAG